MTNPDGRTLTKARKKELWKLLLELRLEHSKLRVQLLDPTHATVLRKLEEGDYTPHVDRVVPRGPGGARRIFTHDKDGNPVFVDLHPGDDAELDQIRVDLELFTDDAVSQIRTFIAAE